MIKKSYGFIARPAVVLFDDKIPVKAHCPCHVGASGLCCHVLALILFLQHLTSTGEKILALTCTEQLQKWHRRSTKSSIPMLPLTAIKVKSTKRRKDSKICPADPDKSYLRDVESMIDTLNKKLDKEKPVSENFFSVLSMTIYKYDLV